MRSGGLILNINKCILIKWIVLATLLFLQCSKGPDIIITGNVSNAIIFGIIRPVTIKAQVNLLKGSDTIASVQTDGVNGNFEFSNISPGNYVIEATGKGRFTEQDIIINENSFRSDLFMSQGNSCIRLYNYGIDSIISPLSMNNNKSVSIIFTIKNDATPLEKPFIVYPDHLSDDYTLTEKYSESALQKTIVLSFKPDSLFLSDKTKKLAITYRYNLKYNSGLMKTDSAKFYWDIDTSGYDSASTLKFLKYIYAGTNQLQIPDKKLNIYPEDAIIIAFNQTMNKGSVEKSLFFAPSFKKVFFWENDSICRIVPSNALQEGYNYTMTIDTATMTSDSQFLRCPIAINFHVYKTSFFVKYSPLDGATNVPLILPFTFESSFDIAPELLKAAFSIIPPVDSLEFVLTRPGLVSLNHAKLLPATSYNITIDSSLVSRKGSPLGEQFEFTFTTVSR
jgi:hypothetical protein